MEAESQQGGLLSGKGEECLKVKSKKAKAKSGALDERQICPRLTRFTLNLLHQKTIEKLEQEREAKDARIKILEQQQHILKAAAGKMNEPDKKEFEQLINKHIREIDKCINLLNN